MRKWIIPLFMYCGIIGHYSIYFLGILLDLVYYKIKLVSGIKNICGGWWMVNVMKGNGER